jgi:hypothetical protein
MGMMDDVSLSAGATYSLTPDATTNSKPSMELAGQRTTDIAAHLVVWLWYVCLLFVPFGNLRIRRHY